MLAAMADLESGRYDVALVLGVEIERNVSGTVGAGYLASAAWVGHEGQGQEFVWPYTFSEIAKEYDRRYGIDSAEMARVLDLPSRTVARRKHEKRFKPEESDRLVRLGRVAALAEQLLL